MRRTSYFTVPWLGNRHQALHLARAVRTGAIRIGSHTGHYQRCFIITNTHPENNKARNCAEIKLPLARFFFSAPLMKCSIIINFSLNHGGYSHGTFGESAQLKFPLFLRHSSRIGGDKIFRLVRLLRLRIDCSPRLPV